MDRSKHIVCALAIIHFAALWATYAVAVEKRVPTPGSLELVDLGWQNTSPQGRLVKADSKYFLVFEGVVTPTVHSMILLEHTKINPGEVVLDIGTGSGIQAIFAADKAKKVVATDIDPKAVENARLNVQRYEKEKVIDVREGDLFAPIKSDEKFDVIIFNLVYPFSKATDHLWEVHRRFFKEVNNYLKPQGRIYYQAGVIDNIPEVKAMIEPNGLEIVQMHMYADKVHGREPIVFTLQMKR